MVSRNIRCSKSCPRCFAIFAILIDTAERGYVMRIMDGRSATRVLHFTTYASRKDANIFCRTPSFLVPQVTLRELNRDGVAVEALGGDTDIVGGIQVLARTVKTMEDNARVLKEWVGAFSSPADVPTGEFKKLCGNVGEYPCPGPNSLMAIDGVNMGTFPHAIMHSLLLCLEREINKRIGDSAATSAGRSLADLNRSIAASLNDFVKLPGPCTHAVAWSSRNLALANFWSFFAQFSCHCYENVRQSVW